MITPSPRPFLAAALLAAAALPATASAAPQWSAPASVLPSAGLPAQGLPSTPTPQVGIGGGRSLVTAGVANRALLTRGSATNVFDTPIATGDSGGAPVSTDAAVGPDGTVVTAWAAGGAGHVAVAGPSGGVSGTADLPGGGVNAVAAAIASDGSTVVAWRSKESASSYSLHVATAPAGSATLGAPQTLEGVAASDSLDLAAGPGGALAIAYRKLTGKYRATVAVRPAGAASFDAPQVVSTAGPNDGDDQSPRVAFDAGGMVVAAWGNPAGASYSLRQPGAGQTFGPPAPLGAAGPAFALDLRSAPHGGTVAAIAGGGTMRAASQVNGGLFGDSVQTGPSFTSQFSGDVAVTAAPGGPTTVVFANPVDGAVHAVDTGGADQVIGYGDKDAVTPVSVASSGDRTVATWGTGDGGVSAATRSATAVPATPGSLGPKPAGRSVAGPKVKYVSGTKRFYVTSKTKTIKFKVRCSEPCRYQLTGALRTQPGAKAKRLIAPLPLVATKTLRSGTVTVTAKLGTLALGDLHKALKTKHGGQLYLDLQAYDRSSNSSSTRILLTLKPKPKAKPRRHHVR